MVVFLSVCTVMQKILINLSFFRIAEEICRRVSWLRANRRYADEKKENCEKTPW